jgi:quercetin dioxygenase-like cupin family protein
VRQIAAGRRAADGECSATRSAAAAARIGLRLQAAPESAARRIDGPSLRATATVGRSRMNTRRLVGSTAIIAAVALGLGLALAQAGEAGGTGHAGMAAAHRVVLPDKLAWGPPPPGLLAGAQGAIVEGDITKPGFFVVRLRAPDGYVVRPHWHSQDEHLTVLSGHAEMGFGDQLGGNVTVGGPGSYFMMPGGQRHSVTMRGETIVQVDGQGPFDIFYVNPGDDPRSKRSSR